MITAVHIITRLEMGGAQENTLYSVEGLRARGINAHLLYGPGGLMDNEAKDRLGEHAHSVPELVHSIALGKDRAGFKALRIKIQQLMNAHAERGETPTEFLVHTHSSKAGFLGRLAAHSAGVSTIVHGIHGFAFHPGQNPLKRKAYVYAERYAGARTHAFVSVSENCLAEARALHIVHDWHKTRVVRSGMDLDPFTSLTAADRKAARSTLNLKESDPVVLSIANFKPQKDPITLIRAFRLLMDQVPTAQLLYAGDGPLRGSVEQEIDKLGLQNNVRLLGWRRDIPTLVAACDAVALSSLFEGLPRSAVQAVAARRPFVGTRVNGTPEIIREGQDGFLVEPREPKQLSDALTHALRQPRHGVTDYARVQDWSIDSMVEAQEDFYKEIVGRR